MIRIRKVILIILFSISLGFSEVWFNGASSVVTYPNNPIYDFDIEMTIMGWFYITKDNWTYMFSNADEAVGGWRVATQPDTDTIHTLWEQDDGTSDNFAPTYAFTYNKWFHYVVTVSSADSVGKLYINGDFVSELNIAGVIYFDSTNDLLIGHEDGLAAFAYFGGSLFDLAIWDRVLSAEEIRNKYEIELISERGMTLLAKLDGINYYTGKIEYNLPEYFNGIHTDTTFVKLAVPVLKR